MDGLRFERGTTRSTVAKPRLAQSKGLAGSHVYGCAGAMTLCVLPETHCAQHLHHRGVRLEGGDPHGPCHPNV